MIAPTIPPSRGRRHERGFTLLEAMITIGIIGFVAGVLTQVYIQGVRGFARGTGQMKVLRDGRSAIDLITRRLREAQATTVRISRATTAEPELSALYFMDLGLPQPKEFRFFQSGDRVVQTVRQWSGTAYDGISSATDTELDGPFPSNWTPNPAPRRMLCSDVRMLKFVPRFDFFSLPGAAILAGGTVSLSGANIVDSVDPTGFGNLLANAYSPAVTGGQITGTAWTFADGAGPAYPGPIPDPAPMPGNPIAPAPVSTAMPSGGPAYPGGFWQITSGSVSLAPGNYVCRKLHWANCSVTVNGPGAVNVYVVGDGDVIGGGPSRFLVDENALFEGCQVNTTSTSAPLAGDPRWFNLYITGAAGANAPANMPVHLDLTSSFCGSIYVPNVQEGVATSVQIDGSHVKGQIMTRGGVVVSGSTTVRFDQRVGGWGAMGTRLRDVLIGISLQHMALKGQNVYSNFAGSATMRNTAFTYYNVP